MNVEEWMNDIELGLEFRQGFLFVVIFFIIVFDIFGLFFFL